MSSIHLGLNPEFVRHADQSFTLALQATKKMGYEYFEPNLITGRCLLSEHGYCHLQSMENDPAWMRDQLAEHGLKPSGVSAHASLMKSDWGVDYLIQAIQYAAAIGAPCVNTDEGKKPVWLSDDEAFELIKLNLRPVLREAERNEVFLALEPHSPYTVKIDTMARLLDLSVSPWLRVNYDSGNVFLAGTDPIEYLETFKDKIVHVHAKDIGGELLEKKGQITGTPVGVACGDGVIDFKQVVSVLDGVGYEGVLCVECGTEEQAGRSIEHLQGILAGS